MASDTITLLGGDCCRPSAVRSSDSTTTMRTKLVIMMMIDGAMDSTVISATICSMRSVNSPLPFKSMERPPLAGAVRRWRRPRSRGVGGAMRSGAAIAACGISERQKQQERQQAFQPGHGALAGLAGNAAFDHGGAIGTRQDQMFDIVAAHDEQALARPHHQVSTTARRLSLAALVTPGTPKRRASRPAPPTMASTSSRAPK